MAKENLADIVKKEFDFLTAEKNDLLGKVAEIDKKLEPINAFLKAEGGKAKTGQKRGRKPKVASGAQKEVQASE